MTGSQLMMGSQFSNRICHEHQDFAKRDFVAQGLCFPPRVVRWQIVVGGQIATMRRPAGPKRSLAEGAGPPW